MTSEQVDILAASVPPKALEQASRAARDTFEACLEFASKVIASPLMEEHDKRGARLMQKGVLIAMCAQSTLDAMVFPAVLELASLIAPRAKAKGVANVDKIKACCEALDHQQEVLKAEISKLGHAN